jgi:hypothetical protein
MCAIFPYDWQGSGLVYMHHYHYVNDALRYDVIMAVIITKKCDFFISIIILWNHHSISHSLLNETSLKANEYLLQVIQVSHLQYDIEIYIYIYIYISICTIMVFTVKCLLHFS